MYIKEVIKYCEDHGKPYTRMGIYTAGKKYGFINKIEGKRALDFDQDKFLEWFENACEEIPEGYITVKQISDMYNISICKAYDIAKNEEIKNRLIGAGKGVLYVDKRDVEEFIKKYKNRRTYDWSKKHGK